ncbi:MAG: fibronectin type III domain-containing protein, partial [Candidatus Paceibacterota bacterium]
MKKYQSILSAALVAVLIIPVTIVMATPKAEAACSYQGYLSSSGKCSKSFGFSNNKYKYDYDDDRYENRYRFNSSYYLSDQYNARIAYLEALIAHLQDLLEKQKELQDNFGESEIDIKTLSARDIDKDSAELRGEIDFNSSDSAEVWFQYGTSINNLNRSTAKVDLDDSDSDLFTRTITGLEDNTLYYFRAVGEDEDGKTDYGTKLSFRTDRDNNDEEPDVTTNSVRNIEDDRATLRGNVDMNNFDNGRIFFVYGEDEDQIEDVENDFDTYSEIAEDGDDLQKVLVDNDLDGNDSYSETVTGLDDDTRHYYSLCVEFENEDGDDKLICGDV